MKCHGNDVTNPSRDNFTLKHSCVICKIPIMDKETVLIDHYLTEFHHYSHDLHPGKKNKDTFNRTSPGFKESPRVALSKIPVMSNLFFCIPCGTKVLFPIGMNGACSGCHTPLDKTEDHTTGLLLKKQMNGFNIHTPIAWHHNCLPDLFKDVKDYAKQRRTKMLGVKRSFR